MVDELDTRAGHELERVHLHLEEVVRVTEWNERLGTEADVVQCRISEYQETSSAWDEAAGREVVVLSAELNDSQVCG